MKKKAPKPRAWGKPHRKVMTMVIPSGKEKANKRTKIKSAVRRALAEDID